MFRNCYWNEQNYPYPYAKKQKNLKIFFKICNGILRKFIELPYLLTGTKWRKVWRGEVVLKVLILLFFSVTNVFLFTECLQ